MSLRNEHFVIIYHYYNITRFIVKISAAILTTVSLQLSGQWTVDYLSFISASEGHFHHKSAAIQFVSLLFRPSIEDDVTAKTKPHIRLCTQR